MTTTFQTPEALRLELDRRGVSLQVRGEKLVCSPKGAAGELLPEVARFKPSLLELLQAEGDCAARDRFPSHLRAHFPIADQIAIGGNLLALDRGEDIEGEAT